jgi:uncharacterized circularly permuted ATP-grasp superfamily protein
MSLSVPMFAESATTPAEWLESYSPTAGRHDELKNVRGEITPVWQKLVEALKGLSAAELNQRAEQVRSLIYENGITYNVYDKQGNHARPWGMDLLPMLIDYPEWDKIERALSQRARLFNLILQDLYGPQTLIEKRVGVGQSRVFASLPRGLAARRHVCADLWRGLGARADRPMVGVVGAS